MSLHNVPSVMDIYPTSPSQRDHLTLDTKHPTAQSIKTLRGGLLRNSKTQASTRGGCQAVEVAHKSLVMTKGGWEAGQTQYMDEGYGVDVLDWRLQHDAAPGHCQLLCGHQQQGATIGGPKPGLAQITNKGACGAL